MTPEQMQKIVDGAPEWADTYLEPTGEYCSIEIEVNDGMHLNIKAIRTQLAKREPMDLRSVDIPHGTIVLEK